MLNEDVLKAMRGVLFMRSNTQDANNPMKLANDQALALVDSLLAGDTIASLWSVEDVYEANGDCVIEQMSKDGEDDGLTWFYCETHGMDTLSDQFCEDHPSIVTYDQAKRVLALAHSEHDAEVGINWAVLQHWIEYVKDNK